MFCLLTREPELYRTAPSTTTPALSMPTTLSPLQGCLSRYGMQTDVPNPLGRPFKLLQLQSHSREGLYWLLSIFSYCLLHKSFEGLPLIDQHSFCNCFRCGESFAEIKYHFSDWRFRPTQLDSRDKDAQLSEMQSIVFTKGSCKETYGTCPSKKEIFL